MNVKSLQKIVLDAIEKYRTYRTDTQLRLLTLNGENFKIEFVGDFCHVCGVSNDYKLVQYFLEENGLNTAVTHVSNFDDGFVAEFRVVK